MELRDNCHNEVGVYRMYLVQITAAVYLFFRTRLFSMGKRAASASAGSRNKRARD